MRTIIRIERRLFVLSNKYEGEQGDDGRRHEADEVPKDEEGDDGGHRRLLNGLGRIAGDEVDGLVNGHVKGIAPVRRLVGLCHSFRATVAVA